MAKYQPKQSHYSSSLALLTTEDRWSMSLVEKYLYTAFELLFSVSTLILNLFLSFFKEPIFETADFRWSKHMILNHKRPKLNPKKA